MRKTSKTNEHFGIIRYAPGSGRFPEEDVCSFDGWFDHAGVVAIFEDWRRLFPGWVVAVVVANEHPHFGGGHFDLGEIKHTDCLRDG